MRKKITAICLSLAMVSEVYTPAFANASNSAAVTSDITSESVAAEQNGTDDTQENSEPSAGKQDDTEYTYEATVSGIMHTAESTTQPCPHKTTIIDKGIPATCMTDGLTEGSHCLECGTVLVARNPIPASSDAHQWSAGELRREEGTDYVNISKAVCTLCGKESGQIRRIRLGDMNQNGQIDLSDVQAVLRYALQIHNMSTAESVLADVNQSSSVDLEDAYLVLKKALRIINNYDDVLVENVTISQSSAAMKIGDALSLTASIYPNNATNQTISWSSSNKTAATVSQSGQVQAIGVGTTTITASAGGHSARCVITVQDNYSPYTANREEIINYILKNGLTDSDGSKFIGMIIDDNDNIATISCKPYSQQLLFTLEYDYQSNRSTLSMAIDTEEAATETATFKLSNSVYRWACVADAIIDTKSYSQTSTLYFNALALIGTTESDIQSVANAELRLAFTSWDYLLYKNLHMTMADIGFVSYAIQ